MLKDIIIAWLNGAEIEWKNPYIKSKWHPLLKYTEGAQVYFGAENRYRIKPKEPNYRELYACGGNHVDGLEKVIVAAKQWQKEHGSV